MDDLLDNLLTMTFLFGGMVLTGEQVKSALALDGAIQWPAKLAAGSTHSDSSSIICFAGFSPKNQAN